MDVRFGLTILIAVAQPLATQCLSVNAAEYFVATTGNNSAGGTSAAPWRTLQFAADQVGPGDRVTVRSGNYAGFHLETSGTAAAPIEFFAEPGVLVNQPNPVRTDHGINLENASYVVIDGFAVTGMNRAGVRSVGVDGDTFASHVTIRNVHSYNNGYWGILTGFVDDLVIENNETSGSVERARHLRLQQRRPSHDSQQHLLGQRPQRHPRQRRRRDWVATASFRTLSSPVTSSTATASTAAAASTWTACKTRASKTICIYDQHSSGISLYRIDGGGGSNGNVVVNNTIHVASDGRWALNIQDGSTGNTALNNILVSSSTSRGAIDISPNSRSGFVSDYNVVISRFTVNGGNSNITLDQWRALPGNENNDDHSFVATPG